MLRPDKIRNTPHASDSLFYPRSNSRARIGACSPEGRHDFLFPSSAEDEGRIRKGTRAKSRGFVGGGEEITLGKRRERERDLFTNPLEDAAKERERIGWNERRVSLANNTKGEEDPQTEEWRQLSRGKERRKKLYRIKSPLAFH